MTLDEALDCWTVHDPGMWDNDLGPRDWYAVSHENLGIVAYFFREEDAFRFRLAEINRLLNG